MGRIATSTNLIRHNRDETETERIHTLGKISAIMRTRLIGRYLLTP